MLVFGVLPTTLGIIGWAMALRNRAPAMAGRAAFEEVGATGRHFLRVLDTTRLTSEEKAALREHTSELNSAMAQANRAEAFSRYRATSCLERGGHIHIDLRYLPFGLQR